MQMTHRRYLSYLKYFGPGAVIACMTIGAEIWLTRTTDWCMGSSPILCLVDHYVCDDYKNSHRIFSNPLFIIIRRAHHDPVLSGETPWMD